MCTNTGDKGVLYNVEENVHLGVVIRWRALLSFNNSHESFYKHIQRAWGLKQYEREINRQTLRDTIPVHRAYIRFCWASMCHTAIKTYIHQDERTHSVQVLWETSFVFWVISIMLVLKVLESGFKLPKVVLIVLGPTYGPHSEMMWDTQWFWQSHLNFIFNSYSDKENKYSILN